MKQLISFWISSLLFIASIHSQDNTYAVIDLAATSKGPNTAVARDRFGRTVYFQLTPSIPKLSNANTSLPKTKAIKIGTAILVDLDNSTVSAVGDTAIKYAIKQPTTSRAIGVVNYLYPYLVSMSYDALAARVGVKLITGKYASFGVRPYDPSEQDFPNKPIYENYYAKKRYAVLLPIKTEERNKILLSFELPDGNDQAMADSVNNTDTTEEQMQNLMSQRPWEIKTDPSLNGIGGEVVMELPKGISYSTHMLFYSAGDRKKAVASWFGSNKSKLAPGLYDIVVDGKYTIPNVPVDKGMETRLKMGFFSVSSYGPVEINNGSTVKFVYASPFTILLPEGTFFIGSMKNHMIVIRDGKQLQL